MFEEEGEAWQPIGAPYTFSPDSYRPVMITEVAGIGVAGKTTAYVRRGNPEITEGQSKYPAESPDEFIAISTRCAHLGCPVQFVPAAGNFICPCHGGVYGFLGERIGGPPVRPLDRFQTRVSNGQVELGPRFSVTSQLDPVRARDPGEFTGGIWDVPLSAAALSAAAAVAMPKLPLPRQLRRPRKPGERRNGAGGDGGGPVEVAKEAGGDAVGWVEERVGAGGFLTFLLFRKVPKGTNWFYTLGTATLFAFTMQAVTGVFLAMYYTPSPTEGYESITHLTNDVFLGEFVRGMHKWGATVMIVVIFLHMGRVFLFGAYKSPIAPAATEAARSKSRRRRAATSSAGSRSAPGRAASSPGCSSARCRRGPTGSTRSAPPPCSPSPCRRSPGSSWRCTTRPRRRRATSRSPTSPTTSSSASSSGGCTSGGRR